MAHKDNPTEPQIALLKNLCQRYSVVYPDVSCMKRSAVGEYIRKIQEKMNLVSKKVVSVITIYSDGSSKIENRK